VEFADRLGLSDWRFLSAAETRSELDSPLYLGAALAPRSGTLHPARLVEGLRAEAVRRGVEIFERSPVERLFGAGRRVEARTARGTVFAGRAVLATNAYSHLLWPRLRHRYLPLYDYILVSDPLTPPQREAIGWRNRQGVVDARPFFNYYRLTSDGRILFGTSDAAYHRGNRVDPGCDHSFPHYEALRESFRRHFPRLGELAFPYSWGGPICSTTRLTPFFGSAAGGRIHYVLGYTGHGIGSTRIAGKILAHQALGRRTRLRELAMVRRKPFPFPPEPLRRAAVGLVTRRLRAVDRGERPGLLLRALEAMGIGFSS
jgi:glycine/D-amino acid oxidase-like deaminating enzyme